MHVHTHGLFVFTLLESERKWRLLTVKLQVVKLSSQVVCFYHEGIEAPKCYIFINKQNTKDLMGLLTADILTQVEIIISAGVIAGSFIMRAGTLEFNETPAFFWGHWILKYILRLKLPPECFVFKMQTVAFYLLPCVFMYFSSENEQNPKGWSALSNSRWHQCL